MSAQYSQFKAMFAITRASLKAVFRSPSAVIFSIAFPLIFILVFGFVGGGGKVYCFCAADRHPQSHLPNIKKDTRYSDHWKIGTGIKRRSWKRKIDRYRQHTKVGFGESALYYSIIQFWSRKPSKLTGTSFYIECCDRRHQSTNIRQHTYHRIGE